MTECWSRPCRPPCRKVAAITGPTRVQLCGRFAVVLDGRPLHPSLPGRRGRLLAYEDLRRLLREELGVSPGPAVRELHTRLLG